MSFFFLRYLRLIFVFSLLPLLVSYCDFSFVKPFPRVWRLACGSFWRACIPLDGLGNEEDVELRQYWAKPGFILEALHFLAYVLLHFPAVLALIFLIH